MKKIAVFPGSFDPITKGHESVIKRALPLFDILYIAIGLNSEKKDFFPLEARKKWVELVFNDYQNIKVITYKGTFFLVGLFVANLLQYKYTASRFDASIPTRKNA